MAARSIHLAVYVDPGFLARIDAFAAARKLTRSSAVLYLAELSLDRLASQSGEAE
jgi:hypothetical protein